MGLYAPAREHEADPRQRSGLPRNVPPYGHDPDGGPYDGDRPRLDFNTNEAALNATGLVFKLYRDHMGTVPVEVGGNSPPLPPDRPAAGGAASRRPNAGSPTWPLDVSAALSADGKLLTIAIVNPTESAQDLDIAIQGAQLRGKGRMWRLTGPESECDDGLGAQRGSGDGSAGERSAKDAPGRADQHRDVRVRKSALDGLRELACGPNRRHPGEKHPAREPRATKIEQPSTPKRPDTATRFWQSLENLAR